MSVFRRLALRVLNLVRSGNAERELTREVEAHLALLENDFRRRGLSPGEARLAARRAFGGVDQVKEAQREARSFRWVEDAWKDVRYALRTLRKTPGFTAIAVLTLALGIGAVTVIYSLVRNVLLDPFPYPHAGRMVNVFVRDGAGEMLRYSLPVPEFLDFQEQSDVFESVGGVWNEMMHYTTGAGAERVRVVTLTPESFAFLGVDALLGRPFGPADATPDAPAVAVLNHRAWMQMFGGDASVIGRTVVLNGVPRTVIGVMPPRFEWNTGDFWIPSALDRSAPDAAKTLRTFQARLRPGVTVEQAEAQLNVIAARRKVHYPAEYPEKSRIQVIRIIDWVVGRFRNVLYTLFAAVGLLLLIACTNVANMLLARATVRQQEISMRAALGASRGRLVRQLLVESALLAVGGMVAGCLVAYAGIGVLARLMPRQGVPWETQLRLDQPVLFFALGTAALATFVFGLFPALQGARGELMTASNSGGRSATATRGQNRIRNVLVVAEVTLSVVLLLGAGVLMRTFLALVGADLGFNPRNLLVVRVAFPPGEGWRTGDMPFYNQALERIRSVPEVVSVSASSGIHPFGGMRNPIEIAGRPASEQDWALVHFTNESYLDTLGIRLAAGRRLSQADVLGARRVALVNEALVRRYFSDRNPLGQSIRLTNLLKMPRPVLDPSFEIVGVVGDVNNFGVRETAMPETYVPFAHIGFPGGLFAIRTAGDPLRVLGAVRHEIHAVNPDVALLRPRAHEVDLQEAFYAQPRFSLLVLGMFAGTGLVLVALGIYGVLAYTVSQQTKDIAIRIALGGERSHVLRMVFRSGLQLLGAGILVGVAAGLATNRLLATQLWNTTPHDAVTLASTVALVLAIGAVACCVPAIRAMRVEPIVALRQE